MLNVTMRETVISLYRTQNNPNNVATQNREIRFPLPRHLDQLETIEFEDRSQTSPSFFNVSKLKYIYGLGYHSFVIRGSSSLRKFSIIDYEMFDSSGTPIQCRVRKNNLTIGASNILFSFLITPDHDNGLARIILVGSATSRTQIGNSNPPIPNVRWTVDITVDKYRSNDSELVFLSTPTVIATEVPAGIVNEDGQEVSIAQLQLNSLTPFSGKVDGVSIFTRLSEMSNDFAQVMTYRLRPLETGSAGPFTSDYVQYATASQITNEINVSSLQISLPLTIVTKPTFYDIRLGFYDGQDEVARNDTGEPLYITLVDQGFSGVDSSQLVYDNVVGATNVIWVNAPSPLLDAGTLLTNNTTIDISWDDVKYLPLSSFPLQTTDIYGTPRLISYSTARRVVKYGLWMFTTTESNYAPEWQFPGKVAMFNINRFNESLFSEKSFPTPDGKGQWSFKGFFSTNYASVDLVRGYTYSFWVGFITSRTLVPTINYYTPEPDIPIS